MIEYGMVQLDLGSGRILLRRYSFHGGRVSMEPSMIVVAFVGGTLAQL